MIRKLKFEVGKTYFDKVWKENFTVEKIDEENNEIDVLYENEVNVLCKYEEGNYPFPLDLSELRLKNGDVFLIEPKKTDE